LINNGTVVINEKSFYYRKVGDNYRNLATTKSTKVRVPVLDVVVLAGIYSNPEDLAYVWNVTIQDNMNLEV